MILALLATLGAIVVAFILFPVFVTDDGSHRPLDSVDIRISDLTDEKARLLEALQDLDFEQASGKVSKQDYDSARADYLQQVSNVMAEIEAIAPKKKSKSARDKTATSDAIACASCRQSNRPGSKFCSECGASLASTACGSCGAELPDGSKFCNACGEKVAS